MYFVKQTKDRYQRNKISSSAELKIGNNRYLTDKAILATGSENWSSYSALVRNTNIARETRGAGEI